MALVSLLTDYGRSDEFAGVLHLVLARLAPGIERVDLTHDLPRHDVAAGALLLWRLVAASPASLAPGVVLAVVDPGVGTARRAVAIEVSPPEGTLHLVGPDNGLLLPAALAAAGRGPADAPIQAVELGGPAWPAGGATFDGRDTFAPAAARLATGTPLGALGAPVDPATLRGGPVPSPRPAPGGAGVVATVVWVDHFGNCQLNVGPVAEPGTPVAVTLPGGRRLEAVTSAAFEGLGEGPGLVTDSYGLSALCRERASAAAAYGLAVGDEVAVARPTPFP